MAAVSAVARPDIHLPQSLARAPYRVVGRTGRCCYSQSRVGGTAVGAALSSP